jgi:hypothetical protein
MRTHIELIHKIWVKEVSRINKPLKLIIIGEAPLSVKKYFYLNNGNYLLDIKKIYEQKCKNLCFDLNDNLASDGIVLVEMYKYLIASKLYNNDRKFKYWDPYYFENQIKILSDKKLIDENTKVVFRYKKLCQNYRQVLVNRDVLPILAKYGISHSNIFKIGNDYSPLTTGANGRIITDPSILKYLNTIIGNHCDKLQKECNSLSNDLKVQQNIFNEILDTLLIYKNVPHLPNLICDPKNEPKIHREIIDNYTKDLDEYNSENVEFWKWPEELRKRPNDMLDNNDLPPKFKHSKFLDLLGCFKLNKPKSVFLYPCVIKRVSVQNNWNCETLAELVYVHECAHYLHYYFNSNNFKSSPFRGEREYYIESFAQLVTEKYCLKHELKNPELLMIFKELCKNQSTEYTVHQDMAPSFGYYKFNFVKDTYLEELPTVEYSICDHYKKRLDILCANSNDLSFVIDLLDVGAFTKNKINPILGVIEGDYFLKI